jgi:hypothetical protein
MRRIGIGTVVVLAAVGLTQAAAGAGLPLHASPSHVSFGSFTISSGFAGPLTATFTNTGKTTIQTGTLFGFAGDAADFAFDPNDSGIDDHTTCDDGNFLAPGETCVISVRFGPGETGHLSLDVYVLDGTNTNHIGKLTVTGRGTA